MARHQTFEIELKAWVEDPGPAGDRLSTFAEFIEEFHRDDTYWFPREGSGGGSLPASGLRIRKERSLDAGGVRKQTIRVTYKSKEIVEGMEVNDEREFEVFPGNAGTDAPADAGAEALEELLYRLNLVPGAAKVKHGRAWRYGDIRAELTCVEGLGWFVELEILTGQDDRETREAARTRLLALLDKTGVNRDKIEDRYYTELLKLAASKGTTP